MLTSVSKKLVQHTVVCASFLETDFWLFLSACLYALSNILLHPTYILFKWHKTLTGAVIEVQQKCSHKITNHLITPF